MLAVHVVAAHASGEQASALQNGFGIFLISAGFVFLSGFVAGLKRSPLTGAELAHGASSGLRLWAVMVAYAVLVSLVRHFLSLGAGGSEACAAQLGWAPPLKLESIGILLPLGIVQMLAPLSRFKRCTGLWIIAALALLFGLMPLALADVNGEGMAGRVAGLLTRRTLTPYYTVSTFVAVGLVGALLARLGALKGPRGIGRVALVVLAVALAHPLSSAAVLDPLYAESTAAGTLATLLYWCALASLVTAAFARPLVAEGGRLRGAMVSFGRASLFTFIAHLFLLELDTFARGLLGGAKSLGVAGGLLALNLVLLFAAVRALARWPGLKVTTDRLLLSVRRSSEGLPTMGGTWSVLAMIGALGTYSGAALAEADRNVLIDDFERTAGCPGWWNFGAVQVERSVDAGTTNRILQVRGEAPGMFAHGLGLYLSRDLEARRTLEVDVRGHGPESGRLRIELADDDNGNWEIEKAPPRYAALHDDRFVYEVDVDWTGWRRLSVPLSAFSDDNPGIGNGVFDPARDLTSGGLLELQLLFAPARGGNDQVRIDLDNLRWTR